MANTRGWSDFSVRSNIKANLEVGMKEKIVMTEWGLERRVSDWE